MDVFNASFDEDKNLHVQHNGNPLDMFNALISIILTSYGYIEREYGVECSTVFKYELLKYIDDYCKIGVSDYLNSPLLCKIDKETNEMVSIPQDVIDVLEQLYNSNENSCE